MVGQRGSTRVGADRERDERAAHGAVEPAGFRVTTPAFELDASAPPLVLTTIRALDTVDDVLELERAFLRAYERRERLVFITEILAVGRIDRRVRHASAEMAQRLRPLDDALSLGAAIVVSSPILRATIVALKWLAKPTVQEDYVSTRAAAVSVVMTRLLAAGIEPDEAILAKLAAFRAAEP